MLKLEMASRTDVGRKRSNNQDYLGDFVLGGVGNGNGTPRKLGSKEAQERGYLFAVADGMGGYAGGEVASELTVLTVFDYYYNKASSGDVGDDLAEAVKQANDAVHREAQSSGRLQMGTTLTMVLVKGNKGIFANVGDSRTYLIRQGLAERVTHDHSMIQEQIDAGYLTPEQAEKSNFRNLITRAIGHREIVEADLFERELQVGDVLLLCSDGLHGLVKESELGTLVATEPNLQSAADHLVKLANERGGPDNITVLMVRVAELGDPLPPLLNGREPIYKSPATIYTQKTTQVANNSFENQPTVPYAATAQAAVTKPLHDQPTTPMRNAGSAELTEKTPGGSGLIVGVIALLLIVGGIVAFVVFSGSNSTSTPTPAITTPGGALTYSPTVNSLPTVTPDPNRPTPDPNRPTPDPNRPPPDRQVPPPPLPTVTPRGP